MTQEQLENLKVGDVLTCIKGNWHFSEGENYVVHQDDISPNLVIWCDDIEVHFVGGLDPDMWEVE